jgi:hypothetical protein
MRADFKQSKHWRYAAARPIARDALRASATSAVINGVIDLSRPKSNQSSKHPLKPPLAVPHQTSSFAGGYWLDG